MKLLYELLGYRWNTNNEDKSDLVLNSNIENIYSILFNHKFHENLNLLMIIPWNLTLNNWTKELPLFYTKDKDKILKYLLNEKKGIFPSTTTTIFELEKNPNFNIEFSLSNDYAFFVDNNQLKYTFHIPNFLFQEHQKILKNYNLDIEKEINIIKNENIINILNYTLTDYSNESNIIYDGKLLNQIKDSIKIIKGGTNEINIDFIIKRFYKIFINLSGFIKSNEVLNYYFSSSGSYNSSNKKGFIQTDGGVLITLKERSNILKQDSTLFISNIIFSKSSISQRAFVGYELKKHAIKSATAAIMARNMSHNLGSHILYYLKVILNNTPKRFENLLYELEHANDNGKILKILKKYKNKIEFVEDSDKIEAPFLIGLGKFLGYLQERQDFIATIASDFIPYFDGLNFKNAIFDEILPDKKQIRHGSYKIKNIFLDFIAKSEDYDSNNIKVFLNGYDGINSGEAVDKIRNFKVDLPGGTLGRQAFFSIFENILRNSAKHNTEDKIETLEINIKINEDTEFKDFYKISIADNVTEFDKMKEIINKALIEPYTNKEGKQLKTNKGIKEMRISAAWLRGLSVAEIDEQEIAEEGEPQKVLDIEKGEDGKLNYVFYVYKSKEIALITNKNYTKKGVDIFKPNDYKKLKNKNYNIVLIDKALEDDTISQIRNSSVPRILIEDFDNFNSIDTENNLNLYYHIKWFEQEFTTIKPLVIIEENRDMSSKSELVKIVKGVANIPYNNNDFILFREHNDKKNKFIDLKDKFPNLYSKASFIEGISGDNSTDRLIRNEEIDDYWAYKMAESALTKVVVLDERLHDTYQKNKESSEHIFTIEDFIDCKDEKDFNTRISSFDAKTNKTIKDFISLYLNETNDEYDKKYYLDKLVKSLNEHSYIANYKKDVFDKKNINLYTMNFDESIKIIDLNNQKVNFSNNLEDFLCSKTSENKPTNDEYKTDFLLIHQGLLDKLYTTLSPKLNHLTDENENAKKEHLFSQLKNLFKVRYNVIIHSGRSEPEYLPSDAIFNQFSSVENALFDCKYTLTELLYSSRKNDK